MTFAAHVRLRLFKMARVAAKRGLWLIGVWPLCAAVLIVSSAYSLDAQERSARVSVDKVAKKEASALAAAYALQLSHTVDQLDQSLMNLKYFWEHVPGSVRLAEQARDGMVVPGENLYIARFDASGLLVDSTVPVAPRTDISADPLFATHAQNAEPGLAITKRGSAPGVPQPHIWFSRRLNRADGRFAGVLAIAVKPHYLGSFYDRTALGRGDFVTVRDTSGTVLSTKMGEQIRAYSGIFRTPPVFKQAYGVANYPAAFFNDNAARLYAWNTLAKYPLISTVGLLESDIYAELIKDFAARRQAWLVIALCMALAALGGSYLTTIYLKRRHAARASRKRYLIAIESGDEGFFSLSPLTDRLGKPVDFVITECNERGAWMLGLTKSAMRGNTISTFCTVRQFPILMDRFLQAMNRGSYEDEFVRTNGDGASCVLYRHLIRSAQGIAVTLRDVTETKAHQAQLYALANRDALTQAFNRHWLMTNLPVAMERALASRNDLALLFIDLDNFKEVNNTYGHGAGDLLLRMACDRFRALIRPQDHLVRWGGDEFAIILERPGVLEVSDVADRIIDGLSKPFLLGDISTDVVRASIGIALFPQDGVTVDTLVHHADAAMYRAKHAGKANFQFYLAASA